MRIFDMEYKLMKNNWDFLNFILSFWIMDLKSYRRRRHAFAVFNIHPFTCQTLLSLSSMKMSISRSGRTGIGQFYSIIQKKGIKEKYSIHHTRSTFSAPEKSTIHGKEGSVRLFTIKLFPHYILATTSKTQIMQTHLMWSLIKIWFVIQFFFFFHKLVFQPNETFISIIMYCCYRWVIDDIIYAMLFVKLLGQ